MTDHLATGMKRMIRTVARSASLSDRLGEQSRLLRLTGNRSTLDFRPAEHGASSWDFEMSITPTEPKPYGNAETREPVWRETVDSATYGESRARWTSPSKRSEYTTTPASCRKRKTGERTTMNDAALLDSLHAALRNPDLAWYTEFHAGESIVAGYLDSLTDPYDDDAIQVPEGWFRYSVVTREGDHALPWMEHWNEYEYSITHHIDWNGKGFTPYDLYCTQDLTGMIADGSLASIREDARTIFKDRPLTDDCLFANSIWPEPELLGLVDDLTGRTGRNL